MDTELCMSRPALQCPRPCSPGELGLAGGQDTHSGTTQNKLAQVPAGGESDPSSQIYSTCSVARAVSQTVHGAGAGTTKVSPREGLESTGQSVFKAHAGAFDLVGLALCQLLQAAGLPLREVLHQTTEQQCLLEGVLGTGECNRERCGVAEEGMLPGLYWHRARFLPRRPYPNPAGT